MRHPSPKSTRRWQGHGKPHLMCIRWRAGRFRSEQVGFSYPLDQKLPARQLLVLSCLLVDVPDGAVEDRTRDGRIVISCERSYALDFAQAGRIIVVGKPRAT